MKALLDLFWALVMGGLVGFAVGVLASWTVAGGLSEVVDARPDLAQWEWYFLAKISPALRAFFAGAGAALLMGEARRNALPQSDLED